MAKYSFIASVVGSSNKKVTGHNIEASSEKEAKAEAREIAQGDYPGKKLEVEVELMK